MSALPRQPREINWSEVAARARDTVGVERIAEFSNRFRIRMLAAADEYRPGDPEVFRFDATARHPTSSIDQDSVPS